MTNQLQSSWDTKAFFLYIVENNTVRQAVAPSRTKKAVTETIKGTESRAILKSCTQEYTQSLLPRSLFENPNLTLSVFLLKHVAFYTLPLYFACSLLSLMT